MSGVSGVDTLVKEDYISVQNPSIKAGFTADTTEGLVPLTVQFTDTSISEITSWNWGYGDGNVSTNQNPEHTYSASGLYSVELKVTGPTGSDSVQISDYIQVNAAPFSVDFSADPLIGESHLTVQFQDLSTGRITGWQWYFGDASSPDGGASTERNPSYTYTQAGIHTVLLTAENNDTSATEIKYNFITVNEGTSVKKISEIPETFHLCQNYPNPFNATTVIEFELPGDRDPPDHI